MTTVVEYQRPGASLKKAIIRDSSPRLELPGWVLVILMWLTLSAPAGTVTEPNYKAAAHFNSQFIKQFTYDLSVNPHWIGKTDRFWYAFKTSQGITYYLVDPVAATRVPLFDHIKMASQLSELAQKPLEPNGLTLTRMTNSDTGTKLTFVLEDSLYEYDLGGEKLTKLGKAPAEAAGAGRGGRGGRGELQQQQQDDQRQQQDDQQIRDQQDRQQQNDNQQQRVVQDNKTDTQQQVTQTTQQQTNTVSDQQLSGGRRGGRGGRGQGGGRRGGNGAGGFGTNDYRNFSPDRSGYVFVKNFNLYYNEVPKPVEKPKAEEKSDKEDGESKDSTKDTAKEESKAKTQETAKADEDQQETPKGKEEQKTEEKKAPVDPDANAIQLTFDGTDEYGFGGGTNNFFGGGGGRGGGGTGTNTFRPVIRPDGKSRGNVTWASNSQSFYVLRRDVRGVKDLFLVNSLSTPRPTLMTYKYPMPGEDEIRKSELFYFTKSEKKLKRIAPKWKDESYSDLGYDKKYSELRFLRTDRLLRHAEFCALALTNGETKCLILEGFETAYLSTQPVRYVEDTEEMIWWSERSGWGHFYLYDRDGKLKNAITSGPFRASGVVSMDTTNRVLYFTATGREPGENLNFEHLYSVRFDGGGLTLLDPGNANHTSQLSPSHKYLVDNHSRVDLSPASILRSADGRQIMALEKADMSKLYEMGWKMPETFVVKAADGITDLFGNLWKPFNFDPKKKYPIILHVYPGPQMEGTTHAFAASGNEQQLAQLGFIVIQVGHRGGTPTRSKAYATYGYFNMRDYPLADKKSAVEQLAARFPFIDLERVGIYGHSGGGFFTAAAMMQKPYNEFFKVGVAESGNHDNNIYNNGWAERYNGLKEIEVKDAQTNTTTGARSREQSTSARSGQANFDPEREAESQLQEDQGGDADVFNMLGTEDEVPQKSESGKEDDKDQTSQKSDRDKEKLKDAETKTEVKKDDTKSGELKKDNATKEEVKKEGVSKDAAAEKKMKFDIHVATNAELAPNLKGRLLLMHGDMDNNVHPANTMRLVDALIRANKRFDMLILPGKPHAYGDMVPYTTQRTWEYFSEYLLNDHSSGADIYDRTGEMPR